MKSYVKLLIAVLILLACWFLHSRKEWFEDIGVSLQGMSNSDRRALSRAALTQQRAQKINELQGLTTKLPANCYDSADPGYNTSNCRALRTKQVAEVNTLVQQNITAYCKGQSDCLPSKRQQYVTQAWTKKCGDQSKQQLAQAALYNGLLSKDNNVFYTVKGKTLKQPCTTVLGTSGRTDPEPLKNPLTDKAATIVLDTKGNATYCTDPHISVSDMSDDKASSVLLRKLGIENSPLTEAVAKDISATDAWLDQYYYFANDPKYKTDAQRLAQCAQQLSQDDFIFNAQALESEARQAQVASAATAPTTGAGSATELIKTYTDARSQKTYASSWYQDFLTKFKAVSASTVSTYNTNTDKINALMATPEMKSYGSWDSLSNLAQTDLKSATAVLNSWDSGRLSGSDPCWGTMPVTATASLSVKGQTFKQYCPDAQSICGQVAANGTDQTSSAWRSCKNFFQQSVDNKKYQDNLTTLKSNPKVKTALDSLSALQQQNVQLLQDKAALDLAIKQVITDLSQAA